MINERCYNVLRVLLGFAGINCDRPDKSLLASDVAKVSGKDILCSPGAGYTSLRQIEAALCQVGESLSSRSRLFTAYDDAKVPNPRKQFEFYQVCGG
jgi:hypothetical protein